MRLKGLSGNVLLQVTIASETPIQKVLGLKEGVTGKEYISSFNFDWNKNTKKNIYRYSEC